MTDSVPETLRERLSSRGVDAVTPLTGGASSLTYRGDYQGRPVVVKVAPPEHPPVGHRDVLRQARMLTALATTDVPVPQVVWEDPGDPPDTPPLFVMSLIDGESTEPLFDTADGPPDPDVPQRYRHAAQAMARLHRIDVAALGFAGEPIVDPAAEIDRWTATLQTVDPALAPGWQAVRDTLHATRPDPWTPAVLHGDFRLGNLLATGTDITAVIDWEIWAIGDPRIDVGWFLINADPQTYRRPTPYVDIAPPVEELIDCYGEAFGAELPALRWFMALACFKSTATWSLIVKHNRRRTTPDDDLEGMAPVVPQLLSRAAALLASTMPGRTMVTEPTSTLR